MEEHKYRRGQRVNFARGFTAAAEGVYEIIALLPHNGSNFSYRIKSGREPYERVAREDQLSAT